MYTLRAKKQNLSDTIWIYFDSFQTTAAQKSNVFILLEFYLMYFIPVGQGIFFMRFHSEFYNGVNKLIICLAIHIIFSTLL